MTDYGILSLADHLDDPVTGERRSQAERLQRVVDAAVDAEQAGFAAFGVGEHHFGGYILSAPELVLAAAAARTERISLGTLVTLLANTDPVRQAEQLATLDMPLFLPSLFRWPVDYVEIVDHYRAKREELGHHAPATVGFPSYLHVASTSQQARRRWRPYLEHYRDFALTLRSSFGRDTDFESLIAGPAICGSPAEVVERIHQIDEELGLSRHIFLLDAGGIPDGLIAEQMELLATEVLPHL